MKNFYIFSLLFMSIGLLAQTTLVDCVDISETDTNDPMTFDFGGPFDVSDCNYITFTATYDGNDGGNTDFSGSGNLESQDECPEFAADCDDDIGDTPTGNCVACWDYLFFEIDHGGSILATATVGLTDSESSSGSWDYSTGGDNNAICLDNDANGTSLSISVILQNWGADEVWNVNCVTLICHDLEVMANVSPDPANVGCPVDLMGTVGSDPDIDISDWSWSPGDAGDAQNDTWTPSSTAEDTYTLEVTDVNGCTASSQAVIAVDPPVDGDTCDDATDEDTLPACVPYSITGDNTGACPDAGIDFCNIETEPTVWHTFIVPSGATSVDVEILSGDVSVTIFQQAGPCPGVSAPVDCLTGGNTLFVPLFLLGDVYNIAISSPNGSEGPYEIELIANIEPINDICTMAISLNNGDTEPGTTTCATGDPNSCEGADHTVFYNYTTGSDPSTLDISLSSVAGITGTAAGDLALAVFDNGCSDLYDEDLPSENCGGGPLQLNCIPPNTEIVLTVSSSSGNEGDFEISIDETSSSSAIAVPEETDMSGIADDDGIVCEGDPFNLEENSGYATIEWWDPTLDPNSDPSTGTGTPFNIVSAAATDHNGTWTVVVTDASGCSGSETIEITVNALPEATDPDFTICFGTDTDTDLTAFDADVDGGNGFTVTYWDGQPSAGGSDLGAYTNVDLTGLSSLWAQVADVNGCLAEVEVTYTVSPEPIADALGPFGPLCSDGNSFDIDLTGTDLDDFIWVNDNTNTGLGASGQGDISFTPDNTGTAQETSIITVTPYSFGPNGSDDAGMLDDCLGTPVDITVTVDPTPDVMNPGDFSYCDTDAGDDVVFMSNLAGTSFVWVSDNDVGFGNSGSGDITGWTADLMGATTTVVATITVTPYTFGPDGANDLGTNDDCLGDEVEFMITVAPVPDVDMPMNLGPLCADLAGPDIIFTSPNIVPDEYAWTMTGDVGFGTSGSGDITGWTAANATGAQIIETMTVTPINYGGDGALGGGDDCVGLEVMFDIIVDPTPDVTNPGDFSYCDMDAADEIIFMGSIAGTSFAWVSDNDIGFGTTGSGDIAAFTADLMGSTTTVIATITVTPYTFGPDGVDDMGTNDDCLGTAEEFMITIAPTPDVDMPMNLGPLCADLTGPDIIFTSPNIVPDEYAWTITGDVGFGTSGSGDITGWTVANATGAQITETMTITPINYGGDGALGGGDDCVGLEVMFDITVDPTPDVTNPGNVEYCDQEAALDIIWMGSLAGTSFSWVSDTDVGFGTNGTGDITGITTDVMGSTSIVVATIDVTPYTFGPDGVDDMGTNDDCVGTPEQFTFTVYPDPTVDAITNIEVCHDDAGTDVLFTGNLDPDTQYDWVATTDVGFGVSGTGDITGWTGVNPGPGDLVSTITVTPVVMHSGPSDCTGMEIMFDITVFPLPTFNFQMSTCQLADLEWTAFIDITDGDLVTSDVGTPADLGGGDWEITGIPDMTDVNITVTNSVTGCEEMYLIPAPDCDCPNVDPPVSLGDITICQGQSLADVGLELEVTPADGAHDIDWYDAQTGGTLLADNTNPFDPGTVFNTPGVFSFWAEEEDIDDSPGCFSIRIEVQVIVTAAPANDVCGSAEAMTGSATGTNACATPDANACGGDHVVYYSYTTTTDGATVEVTTMTVAGPTGTPANAVGLSVFDGSCGTLYDATSEDCAGGPVTLNCVPMGTALFFAVSSADGDEGDFSISVTEMANPSSPANDLCTNADDAGELAVCTPVTLMGDNTSACPDFNLTNCNIGTEPTVWHTFTVPAGATSVDITNITGGVNLTFTDNACPPTSVIEDCISADMTSTNFTAGTTYNVAVTTPFGSEAAYSFDLTALVPPANDMCGNAETLSAGTAASGTNACASADANACGGDHVVYYTYTTVGPDAATIEVTVAAAAGPTGTPAGSLGTSVFDGSCTTLYNSDPNAQDCGGGVVSLDCVPPGTVLNIAISSPDMSEGDFELTITEMPNAAGPANDLCANADDAGELLVCTPVTLSGNNTDACPESFTNCNMNTQATVWHTFSVPAGATSVDITNITGGVSLVFTDAACPISTVFEDCVSGDMTSTNLVGGMTYNVAVTTPVGAEAAYTFDLTALVPPANDMCANAEALGGNATGTNACASADANACGGDHVVYYTYTTAGPDPATIEVTVAPSGAGPTGVAATSLGISVFDASCATLYNADAQMCDGSPVELNCVPPGTVLNIAISSPDMSEGDFDVTISEMPNAGAPGNDACTAPQDEGELLICAPVTVSGDNTNACPEQITNCTMDSQPTTWHTFTVPTGATSVEFANVMGGVTLAVFDVACPPTTVFEDCFTGNLASMNLAAGTTFMIGVTTPFGAESAYSFDITALVAPDNDVCGSAEALSGSATGTNACASEDPMACGGRNHVVYYSYSTVGPGSSTIEVTVTPTSGPTMNPAGSVGVSVYDGCGGLYDPALPSEDCGGGPLEVPCVPAGTNLVFAVSSPDTQEGDFSISVTETPNAAGPANDFCDMPQAEAAEECVPINISGNTSMACPETTNNCSEGDNPNTWHEVTLPAGTTTVDITDLSGGLNVGIWTACGSFLQCVTADTPDINVGGAGSLIISTNLTGTEGPYNFNFTANVSPANDFCQNAIDGSGSGTTCCAGDDMVGNCGFANTVWHSYVPTTGSAQVDVSSSGGTLGVDVFTGDCSALTPVDMGNYCGDPGGFMTIDVACIDPGTAIFVQISNVDEDACGDYNITFTEPEACTVGLDCGSGNATNPSTNGGPACLSACNDFVCGMDGCGENVIWFEFTTDDQASNAVITVNGADFNPAVSVFPIACDEAPVATCSPSPFAIPVNPNTTYFVSVSNVDGPTGDFELCIQTFLAFAECGNADELMITRPDYPDLPPEGPYCPGEKVNICYSVNYTIDSTTDPDGNNCQWIQGIVPSIGGGWDLEDCPIEDQGPSGWNWLPEGSVDYNINESIYQLTTNCDGALELTLGGGLGSGDLLPAGWWFVSPGGNPGCVASGDPDDMWGLPGGCGSSYTVAFCFDLRVREIEDLDQCADPCFTDLKVNIFTFADGQTGCWSVNSCAADEPAIFDAIIDCSAIVTVEGTGDEICSGGTAELTVTAEDGISTIIVEAVDNPNVEGETSGELSFGGNGFFLEGPLVNTGTDVEIVIYEAFVPSPNPDSECNGPTIEIEVTVYPEIEIEFDESPFQICSDEQEDIAPIVTGGQGSGYSFDWDDGETGSTYTAPPSLPGSPGLNFISVTVTDPLGCTGDATAQYYIREEITAEIIVDDLDFACINNVDDQQSFTVDVLTGEGPFSYQWITPNGLDSEDDDEETIIFDEESSFSFPGTYLVSVIVTDTEGCEYETEPLQFTVSEGPEIEVVEVLCESEDGDFVCYNIEIESTTGDAVAFTLFDISGNELDGPYLTDNVIFECVVDGEYFVQAEDLTLGCISELELEPLETERPEEDIQEPECPGDFVVIDIFNGGEFEFFTWVGEDGSILESGGNEDRLEIPIFPETDFNGDGTVEITLEVELPEGCLIREVYEIEPTGVDPIFIEGSESFCTGSFTTLSVEDPDSDVDYEWTSPSGTISTGETVDASEEGTWTLTAFFGACSSETMVDISEDSNLSPIINGSAFCAGTMTTLTTGTTFTSYSWEGPSGPLPDTDFDIEVNEAGTYSVTVFDATGCNGVGTFPLDEIPAVEITTMPGTVCNSTNGSLSPIIDLTTLVSVTNASSTVFLRDDGSPLTSPVLDFDQTNASTQIYQVVGIGNTPCANDTMDIIINVTDCACPIIGLSQIPPLCADGADTLNVDLFLSQNTSPGDFSISSIGGGVITLDTSNPPSVLMILSETTTPDTYSLTYTLNPAPIGADCTADTTVTFIVSEDPDPMFSTPTPVCNSAASGQGTTADLTSYLTYPGTGVWTIGNDTIQDPTNVDFVDVTPGPVNIIFTTNDAQAPCSNNPIQLVIQVIDCNCPTIGIDLPGPFCNDTTAILLDTFRIDGTEDGVWSLFQNPDAGYVLPPTNIFDPNGLTAGDYIFEYTLSDPVVGCTNSVMGTITIESLIDLPDLSQIDACNATTNEIAPIVINLDDYIDPAQFSGDWVAPNKYNDGNGIPDITAVSFLGEDPGLYQFVFTTNNAVSPCGESTVTLNIRVLDCDCPGVSINNFINLCNNDDPATNSLNLFDMVFFPADGYQIGYTEGPLDPSEIVLVNDSIWVVDGLPDGLYSFAVVLDTVILGCDLRDTFDVFISQAWDFDFVDNLTACNVTSTAGTPIVDLEAISDTIPGTWTAPIIFPNGPVTDFSAVDFTDLNPGDSYEFIFTSNTNGPCPALSDTVTITVLDCDCPPFALLPSTDLCNGLVSTSVNLNDYINPITEGNVLIMDSGEGPESVSIGSDGTFDATGLMPGTYEFYYMLDTILAGCNVLDSLSFVVEDAPSVDLGNDLVACNAVSVTGETVLDLASLVNQTGTWTEPAGFPNGPVTDFSAVDFEDLNPGDSYAFVFTTDAVAPCIAATDTIMVQVQDCNCPNVAITGSTDLCSSGDATQTMYDVTQFETANITDGTFTAIGPDGQPIVLNGNIFDATGLTSGTYDIIFTPTVMPAADCPQGDTVQIQINTPPTAGIVASSPSFCADEPGQNIVLFSLLDDADTGGDWTETSTVSSTNGAFNPVMGMFNTDGQLPGTYTFEYVLGAAAPCDGASETVVVVIDAVPSADAGSADLLNCGNPTTVIGGPGTSQGADFSYEWTNDAGAVIATQDTLEVAAGGMYTLTVMNNVTGCTTSESITVVADESIPSVVAFADPTCVGETEGIITIDAVTGGTPPYEFTVSGSTINFEESAVINDPNEFPISYNDLEAGSYILTLIDDAGCPFEQILVVTENDSITALILSDSEDQTVPLGGEVTFDILLNDSLNVAQVNWYQGMPGEGDLLCSGTLADCGTITEVPNLTPTEYCVEVITFDGCIAIACRSEQAQDERDIFVTNVIDIGGNNQNENGTIYPQAPDGLIVMVNEFSIFDRWGNRMYTKTNFLANEINEGWNGFFGGEPVEQGVYVWYLEVEWRDDGNPATPDIEAFVGDVTILR